MTKLLEENRLKTFVPGLGWTGGSTKSQLMKLLASLARSSALARSTAVMDGDPKISRHVRFLVSVMQTAT